jgi:hypothetical protein
LASLSSLITVTNYPQLTSALTPTTFSVTFFHSTSNLSVSNFIEWTLTCYFSFIPSFFTTYFS